MSQEPITGTIPSCKTATRIGCKVVLSSCAQKFLVLFEKSMRIFISNSKEFIQASQDLQWTNDTKTPHRSVTNWTADLDVRRVQIRRNSDSGGSTQWRTGLCDGNVVATSVTYQLYWDCTQKDAEVDQMVFKPKQTYSDESAPETWRMRNKTKIQIPFKRSQRGVVTYKDTPKNVSFRVASLLEKPYLHWVSGNTGHGSSSMFTWRFEQYRRRDTNLWNTNTWPELEDLMYFGRPICWHDLSPTGTKRMTKDWHANLDSPGRILRRRLTIFQINFRRCFLEYLNQKLLFQFPPRGISEQSCLTAVSNQK